MLKQIGDSSLAATDTLVPDRVVCQNNDLVGDPLRSFQPDEQQADVVEPRRRVYRPTGFVHYRLKLLQKVHRHDCQYNWPRQFNNAGTFTLWNVCFRERINRAFYDIAGECKGECYCGGSGWG